jgi:NYN domain
MGKRSIIYVDGFNLFYGMLKGTKYKWLNLEKLFRMLRQDDDIQEICYFTALVDSPASSDQQAYLAAIGTLSLLTIVEGKFKTREVRCRVKNCQHRGNRIFKAPEEKRTDVNIALRLLDDAFMDRADRFVLVTGDSDLVPALDLVKERFPEKRLTLYVPAPSRVHVRAGAKELRAAADRHRTLPIAAVKSAQLPAVVTDASGDRISKPMGW